MPTYDYKHLDKKIRCSKGRSFTEFQQMTSDALVKCEECKQPVQRLIGSGGGIIFKGTGFYCTDYKKEKK